MPSTIKLEIVTPENVVYSEDINVLEAPAMDGLIGILPRHAPLVTGLKTGVLQIKQAEENVRIPISDGFMEVKPEQINVVVRTAELPHEIDLERARRAKERAEKRLESDNSKQIDFARAQSALERALARIKAVDHHDL
ncbi:F0F1 ATP synthase subunit epsilon [Iocasia frigidifontis]|uniref:ATP synthase epsilon chain n=1 Tax=Iocasia fonsfrigidae TaxID=2682810 RepID=A0A8A7KFE2_9FIRM|nr:F0F1 ATP synthase subunit epsilon [Iocasia fonsfrigidae]QTL96874.1 F0F1 ATP synthase subunit epsilon [Iocasia fonsfrigidae]